MASTTSTAASEEVTLLDKLLYRLVMTDESKVEAAIADHLPTLLDKLTTTPHEAVRNKVVECCSHLLKRIRADSNLQVPCTMLLGKIKAEDAGAFTKNFALVFLEIGCPRLTPQGKAELGQALLVGIAGGAAEGPYGRQQVALVHRLLEVLEFVKPLSLTLAIGSTNNAGAATPQQEQQPDFLPTPYPPLQPSPRDKAFLQELFLDLLLIPNATRLVKPPPNTNTNTPLPGAIMGLSHEGLQRIASHPTLWAPSQQTRNPQTTLAKLKLDVLRLLHSPLFTYSASIPLLLVATTDSETRVKERAETLVKIQTDARATNTFALTPEAKAAEDQRLADRVLRLFLGGTDSLPRDAQLQGLQGLVLPRGVLSESARVRLLEWAMRECPESLLANSPENAGLCLKAALQTLTSPNEGPATRALGARLAAFVAVRCPPALFALAGPLLLAAVKKVLIGCYQALLLARSSSSSSAGAGNGMDRDAAVREGCYETLAGLAHRMSGTLIAHPSTTTSQSTNTQAPKTHNPHLLFTDPLLLRLLFEALASEGPVQAIKVAEALGALRTAYLPAKQHLGRSPVDMSQLCPLLCQAATNDQPRARLAAVEWAVTALSSAEVLPRSLCLQLMDDSVLAVRRAASAGLGVSFLPIAPGEEEELPVYPQALPEKKKKGGGDDTHTHAQSSEEEESGAILMPPFPLLASALLSTEKGIGKFPLIGMGVKGQARAFHFLWLSFLATTTTHTDTHTHTYPQEILTPLTHLVQWLRTQALGDPVHARQNLRVLYRSAAMCLASLVRVLPLPSLQALATTEMELLWLQGWLVHEDAALGESVAQLMGVLRPYMPEQKLTTALYALAGMVDKATERRDPRAARGPLLAIGYMLAGARACAGGGGGKEEGGSTQTHTHTHTKHTHETVTLVAASAVARAARHALNEIHAAACQSLSLMGSTAPLPLLASSSSTSTSSTSTSSPPPNHPPTPTPTTLPPNLQRVEDVMEGLLADIKSSGAGTPKERRGEAAAGCLAALAKGGKTSLPMRKEAQEVCLGVGGVRDDELQFAVGQALAALALVSEGDFEGVWGKVVEEKVEDHSPHVRAAATLWLLVLLSEVAVYTQTLTQTDTQLLLTFPRLEKAQEVLVKLLRDKSELGQEASGKALGVIYAVAKHTQSNTHTQNLIDALVLLLRGPKAVAQPTQLEMNVPSAIPMQTSVDIGTNNPFRELCILATDLNQPQLMYHFLALPSTHTSWAGRRASTYASSSLVSEEELKLALGPLLPRLIPRLYRTRFDPTHAVRQAMEPLWKTVAPDGKAAVKMYLEAILEDLCAAAGSRKWRERQAAVAGLAELLPGRTYVEVGGMLDKLWTIGFRSLDDLKESVAMAGIDLAKSLSQLSARLTNREETPPAQVEEVVGVLLPKLLQQGLPNKCKEVQAIAVMTLVRLVKGAGECIRPYLAELVSALIEAQSATESEKLAYLQFHAQSMNMTEEGMEQLRYSLSRSGPLQEALDHCLKELDGPSLTQLMPHLLMHLRSGVGLNTRCCAANVVVVVATRFRLEVRPHIPALLRVLAAGSLAERSATAQRFFLGALATVAKIAHEYDVRRLILRLCREYRHSADLAVHRTRRLPIVAALRQLCGAAGESLEGEAWVTVLPLAYLGRQDEEEVVKKAWEEIWADGCAAYGKGGNTARALAPELCREVEVGLVSSSWLLRRGALLALADLTDILGEALKPQAYKLVHDLLLLLPGRLWDGKENVLMALVKIVGKCPEMVDVEGAPVWLFCEGAGGCVFPPGLVRGVEEEEGEGEGEGEGEKEEEGVGEGEGGEVVMEIGNINVINEAGVEVSEPGSEARDEEAFSRLLVTTEEEAGAMDVVAEATAATTTTSSSNNISSSSSNGEQRNMISYRGLVRVLVDQCSRSHRDYRRAAVQCLMDLSLAFPLIDILATAQETLIRLAGGLELSSSSSSSSSAMAVVGAESGVDHVLRARAVEALGVLFPPCTTASSSYLTQKEALPWLLPMLLSRATFAVWSLRQAVFKALRTIMQRIYVRPDDESNSNNVGEYGPSLLTGGVAERVVDVCLKGMDDAKYNQVRLFATEVLLALIKRKEIEARMAIMPQLERMQEGLDKLMKNGNPDCLRLATEAKALLL